MVQYYRIVKTEVMNMYSTARKLSLLTAILGAVNVVGVILYLLASVTLEITFALSFAIFMILASSAAANLLLTVALRSICLDLEYEYEDTQKKISSLTKRINELEGRR